MARFKKSRQPLLTLLLLFFLLLSVLFFWWRTSNKPVDPQEKSQKIFVIKKGEKVDKIAKNLKEKNLVKSPLAFKLKAYQLGLIKKIQAGDYRLSPSMNLAQVTQALSHGTLDQWITIPEGWRAEEIIVYLKKNFFQGELSETERQLFLKKEGYLFPDTYLIPKKATAQNIIDILQKNFDQKFNLELEKQAQKNNLTKNEVIILASLVEREAKHSKDHPLIAGILLKRLQKDWPLQVDATLQYALANNQCKISEEKCAWWPQPKPEDKKIRSSYNTYQNPGLPPGPICNPGLSSIKAVIFLQDSEYWYYLSDQKGNVHYSETLEEHQENIRKYLSQD